MASRSNLLSEHKKERSRARRVASTPNAKNLNRSMDTKGMKRLVEESFDEN